MGEGVETLNNRPSITYFGFTLTVYRSEEAGGWYAVVNDPQGRLVSDGIKAPWISQSEAEKRAVDIAKRELAKMGEATPKEYPDWGSIVFPLIDKN